MSLSIPTNLTPDLSRRAGRMLAAGRLTATVTSKRTGQHITVSIKCCRNAPDAPYGQKWPTTSPAEATHVFLEAGKHDKIGVIYPQRDRYSLYTGYDPAREYAAAMVLRYACGEHFESEIVEADQCGCCGRKLTDPESIARGIGPECYGKQTEAEHQTRQTALVLACDEDEITRFEEQGEREEAMQP